MRPWTAVTSPHIWVSGWPIFQFQQSRFQIHLKILCMQTCQSLFGFAWPYKNHAIPFPGNAFVLFLTRSCPPLNLVSSGSPSGPYQTVKSWLHSEDTLHQRETSVQDRVIAVFDNNQSLQCIWRISTNNTVMSSTITMVAIPETPFVNLMYTP